MSNKSKLFDDEMDEKTVEIISDDFPILTDEEKDRIFSLIEKEFDTDTSKNNDYGDEVKGVEKIVRPRWIERLGTAAMIAIVFGGLGGGGYLMSNMEKNAPKDREQEVTTETLTTSPVQQATADNTPTPVTTSGKTDDRPVTTSVVMVAVPVLTVTDIGPSKAEDINTAPYDISTVPVVTTNLAVTTTDVTTTFAESDTTVCSSAFTSTTYVDDTEIVTTYIRTDNDNNDEDDLTEIAEELIEKYDTIREIKTAQLPHDYDEHKLVTFRHDPSNPTSMPYNMHYHKIDSNVFGNMQELKDYYYSVMSQQYTDARMFGPELSFADVENNYVFGSDAPDYFYISIDGELYGNVISKLDLSSRTDEPVEVFDISERSFKASKQYYKTNADNKIVTATFWFIKDYDTEKWLIDYVSY
ncbi:MAG: hypothetical protein K6G33_09565 [Ruminococcus sp.]|uniref:hypothetical protein n=1 Tax=Ruminococcus sp. TaxID=41978 RepID=UPI0025F7D187|nr:hypothetical protein [Ruminococcus sp.]MCR5600970.1 hypothetical protein [Ruminococcus sp.]